MILFECLNGTSFHAAEIWLFGARLWLMQTDVLPATIPPCPFCGSKIHTTPPEKRENIVADASSGKSQE